MSAFTPQPLGVLLARAQTELARERSVFGLPRRSFWRGRDGFDLSVDIPGGRIANPLGPAAGPHTQLAHSLVVAWLAGSRVLELKTVQILDRLEIPRPCIDAPAEGYDVEWSQELRLEQSLEQYVTAWVLIHALAATGIAGDPVAALPRFRASVGYDLAGIRSDRVGRFLDDLVDAGDLIESLRDRLPRELRAALDADIPARVVDTVALSTFHGCPAEEIERIVEHLVERHGVNVVVKLNPTLLGYDPVRTMLHDRLGYHDIVPDRGAFEHDLHWDHALPLLDRLSRVARRQGRDLGIQLTNTLVVRNTRGRLAGDVVYLSGAPLHPLAVSLADRFTRATGGRFPMSFSSGVCAENFADTVACGFAPVTTCTDLLRPTGYRRLPRYLKALEAEFERTGVPSVDAYRIARAGGGPGLSPAAAAMLNLSAYASRVADDPRYHAAPDRHATPVRRPLALLDCDSCNNCALVCPNGAFFSVELTPVRIPTYEVSVERGALVRRPDVLEWTREPQWVLYAGFCNDCGNCDTFCPQEGGPHHVKARFFGSRAEYAAADPGDGIVIEDGGRRIVARMDGVEHRLVRDGAQEIFDDGVIEARLNAAHEPVEIRALAPREGHVLGLWRYHALRLLCDAVLAGVNPVTALQHGAGVE